MKILVYEDNLIWSSRFVKSLKSLGHEPIVVKAAIPESAEIAIVNLGSDSLDPAKLVPSLVELGVKVIGHAGHKEKDLLQLGRSSGCQLVATNSEITFKLPELLETALN